MIDVAKTCDLALLLVDASYGFEMETFEFLNAAQIHGFPRVMGVLTHLDKYKKLKKKQSIVYHVKHRFWKEIYAGAKLFILKGKDLKTGYYYKSDIINLVRFISVLKFRPLTWRNSHPYLLCDRYEDLTEPALKQENKKIDRKIAFYGYVRGCNFRTLMNIHLFGVGDFPIESISEMEDPMPLPTNRMRHLVKTGTVYAPMANIGPVIFDKSAAYITIRDAENAVRDDRKKHSWETEESYLKRLKKEATENEMEKLIDIKFGVGKQMIERLSKVETGIDSQLKTSAVQLFNNSQPLTELDIEQFEHKKELKRIHEQKNRVRRRVTFDDDVVVSDVSDIEDSDVNDDDNVVIDDDDNVINDDGNENDLEMDEKNDDENNSKFFSENWLDSNSEQQRKQKEITQNKLKAHRKKIAQNAKIGSKSVKESNIRWKQNLLTNAGQIWKTSINLQQYVYGNTTKKKSNISKMNESEDDSDEDFFRIQQTSKMKMSEIDSIDSSVIAYDLMNIKLGPIENYKNINHEEIQKTEEKDDVLMDERLSNRFVTGDWIAAQNFEREVRKRAMNVNPDLFDEDIQKDRQILESLGAQTMDIPENNFSEQQLDWEYLLEKMMKDKGIDGEISMTDKIKFAQKGIFTKNDIQTDEKTIDDLFVDSKALSTLDLEDLNKIEAKILKKQAFNREFDAGLLEDRDLIYDQTGIAEEQQRKIFKNPFVKIKRDRQGKIRGQGELNMDDRKNLPGSGKGEYYMDIVRAEMQKQQEINRVL